jgi:flagellar protein FliO/FliZ
MELEGYFRFILALVFVLGLIGLCAWLVKRFGMAPKVSRTSSERRLKIVEIAALDAKRRLLLVRRDDTEHLLMLGATNDIVVERGIAAPVETDIAAEVPARMTGGGQL